MRPRVVLLFVLLLPISATAQTSFTHSITLPDIRSDTVPKAVTRSCGPFALACLHRAKDRHFDDSTTEALNALDPYGTGTTPQKITDYCNTHFLPGTAHQTHATVKQLRCHLDRGRPVLLAVRANEPHWALLVGYHSYPQGTSWDLVDNGAVEGMVSTKGLLRLWDCYPNTPRVAVFCNTPCRKRSQVSVPISVSSRDNNAERILAALLRARQYDAPDWVAALVTVELGTGLTHNQFRDYLSSRFRVWKKPQARFNEIEARISAGYPVLLSRTTDGILHWSLVTGFLKDVDGTTVSWNVVDNYTLSSEISHHDFARSWHVEHQGHQFRPALFLADK